VQGRGIAQQIAVLRVVASDRLLAFAQRGRGSIAPLPRHPLLEPRRVPVPAKADARKRVRPSDDSAE
jgi:hypothetical protein